MAESSQQQSIPSAPTKSPSSNDSSASASGEAQSTKRGRPSKWNKSRQRKLARLYLYSTLPPKDISLALEDKENNWKPGKESTVKTVNALLDNQPRWLRPKNREEMDSKISELKNVHKKGKATATNTPTTDPEMDLYSPYEIGEIGFSETPLQDLLGEPLPLPSNVDSSRPTSALAHSAFYSFPFDIPFLEHPLDPPGSSPQPPVKRERTNSSHPYSYQDIARGARGIRYHTFYQCPICDRTNAHSDSFLDQMKCAYKCGRDRISPDLEGMTPAHALIMYQRNNNDEDITPETPEQTAELFRTLFPQDDNVLRRALYILDPAGNTLIHNITAKGFTEILDYIEEITASSDEPVVLNKPVAVDEKTLSTHMTTSSLKKRLPQYSARYLKGISRLIKSHSISESSREETPVITTPKRVPDFIPSCAPTLGGVSTLSQLSHSTVSILPDAFLSVDRHIQKQGICIPGFKAHDNKTCWCHILDGINTGVWVGNTGLVDDRVSDPPKSLRFLNLRFKDNFGNNVLHMLAARGAPFELMIQVLERGVNGNEKNTADQTFLHVLRRQILRTLAEDGDTLMSVLQKLNVFNVRLHDCDFLGRSFIHILAKQAHRHKENSLFALQMLNIPLPSGRDALGYKPTLVVESPGPTFNSFEPPPIVRQPPPQSAYVPSVEPREFRRPNSIIHQPLFEEEPEPVAPLAVLSPVASSTGTPALDEHEAYVLRHARMLETARGAFTNPRIEDAEGRNGLQCLAEASLTLSIDSSQVTKPFSNKRKMDGPEPVRSTAKLGLRYELIEKLLAAGVNPNNYDKAGFTVLMSCVKHLQDGEDDKILAKLFRHLIDSGANIHWRNRQGETALHIAVSLGRKVATKSLLERGSNPHARTADGLGVLALGEISYLRAKNDPPLYSSIMACMAMCIHFEAVASPTLVMEWAKKT